MPRTRIAIPGKERTMAKKQKTVCPINRAQFKQGARPVAITIAGQGMEVPVKFFSTGSLGWYLNKRTTIEVAGQPVDVQIGLNLTIVGSKELPQDEPAATPATAPASHQQPGGDAPGAHA
jgi:hypothetical protein